MSVPYSTFALDLELIEWWVFSRKAVGPCRS
jgi:hypothetical protein